MQFTLRDALEEEYGKAATDAIFKKAGKIAGSAFYARYIGPVSTMDEFIRNAQKALREQRIGILRIEDVSSEGNVTLTVGEDLDCSGLPELEYELCIYDAGFIAALFEAFTQTPWKATEIDCWCTGARTCRFLVENLGHNSDTSSGNSGLGQEI